MTEGASKTPLDPKVPLLYVINQLLIKAMGAESKEALQFIIANDTIHLVHYDRSLLFGFDHHETELLAISGLTQVNKYSEKVRKLKNIALYIDEPTKPQILTEASFWREKNLWKELEIQSESTVMWLPMMIDDKLVLGLWLEKWKGGQPFNLPSKEVLQLLMGSLMAGYANAYVKFQSRFSFKKLLKKDKTQWYVAAFTIFVLSLLIHVPLRVVAPLEIVPKDPYVISAPLEGIIESIQVTPGQAVGKEEVLAKYDGRVPLQSLKIAERQVDIAEKELNRVMTLGIRDEKAQSELAVVQQKLQKELAAFELAKYQASLLNVASPADGIVILDNPEEWRGRPVKVGEKIMTIADPENTKLKIWIPENDNVLLRFDKPLKIYLNISPNKSYEARLVYVANESYVNEENIHSFLAEALFTTPPKDIKLGLKGTAILYGDSVPLLYYLIRKPWASVRKLAGL